ncbi:uncharacterized protein TM35_000123400 [Trypanosoma theileri]|uniref:Mucin-associated surface protein (MASP) n=1 Tax=Trypanosoma theileri TaxID=67003 RepID=A0A1X0NY18_9TRYP|nr:uncharacterized protein TM35_000123400 [Trypanosoma theileri]ORC89565.1 hypothetical protein TM35_000123400 [Trypanosoma theileri]
MTTMFVQLRRVVYLLVLLQCCACVAYAESVTDPITHEESDPSLFLKDMIEKMKTERGLINDDLHSLRTMENKCSEALNRAKNATTKANEVRKLMETLLKEIRNPETRSEKESEAKELLRKAVDAQREATDAAGKAKSIAATTAGLVSTLQDRTMELHSLAEFLKNIVDKHINAGGRKELVEEYQKEADKVLSSLNDDVMDFKSVNKVAEEAKKQAEVASFEAKNVQAFIDEIFQKYPEIKEEVERESKEATQTSNNSTNTGSEGNKTPNENKEVEGLHPNKQNEENTRNQNTNTAQTETGSHTTAQQQQNEQNSEGQNNKESKDETQHKNQNPQSNPPTDSNSSATGTSQSQNIPTNSSTASETPQSQNMPTNSPSSASIHLNITQLSDSSSSPALVHSPLLLLLVLMCVLGCTVVC